MSRQKALIYLVIASLFWSTGGLFIKLVTWHPLAIAGGRSLIAAIFLIAMLGVPKAKFSRIEVLTGIAYALTVVLFVVSNKYTTAANSILIQYTGPIYVVILSPWLLKERISFSDILFVTVSLLGLILFFLDELAPGNAFGNFLAMLSGACFGVMVVLLRIQKDGDPVRSMILGNLFAALVGAPFMFEQPLSMDSFLGLLFLGVVQLGLSYYLYSFAIREVTALDAILIPMLEPILNPVWVFLMTGEKPGDWALLGGAVVVLAVFAKGLTALRSTRKNPEKRACDV